MQEKDDKPKRGRKVVATPAAKAAPAASSEKKTATKKAVPAKKAGPVKDNSEDDKASKIAQALFGDESAASAEAPSQASPAAESNEQSGQTNPSSEPGQGAPANGGGQNGPNHPAQRYPQPNELVAAIAEHFRQQPFYYSLRPPALGRDSVDQFLFQTRTGFCSHYASATALLLRHAGIPARVVGGYLGGDWHAEQGYLAVRQREAHAWVEYLQQGQWQRFDPTAAVAPQRVLDSLDMALPENERDMLRSPWQSFALIQLFSQQLMHLDYYWSVWVLGFDDTQQQNLWHVLRKHWPAILYTMAALLLLSLCIGLLLWYRRSRLNRPAIAQRLVLSALKPLLVAKPSQQSVSGYLQQLAANHPAYAEPLLQITEQYDLAVYASQPQAEHELRKRLKQYQQQFKQLNRLIQNT
mgnify:CR=1 FL=1